MRTPRKCRKCHWEIPIFSFSCPGCGRLSKSKVRAAITYLALVLVSGCVAGILLWQITREKHEKAFSKPEDRDPRLQQIQADAKKIAERMKAEAAELRAISAVKSSPARDARVEEIAEDMRQNKATPKP